MKQLLKRLVKWEYFWLYLIVLVTLAGHFSLITQPQELMFDEQHYIPDARSILADNGTLRFEHPPLGKLFTISGISLFGDNPVGWRFFPIIFGTGCIALFYLICRRLGMSKRTSSLATFLLAFENMTFVQAGIAMLDVYSLFFMLASFWLYLRGNYPLAGVFVGLSALAKLFGALALGAIVLHWLLIRRERRIHFIASMLLAPVSFVLLMPLFDYFIFGEFVNPIERIYMMLTLSGGLTFATVPHGSKSRPWDWLIRPDLIPYWVDPNYFGAISYTILALIIPSVLYMLFKTIKHNDAGTFGISWFISTYLVWIPASIITNRVSYVYYFYPTIGAIAIGIGMGLSQLIDIWWRKKRSIIRWLLILLVALYLLAHILVFIWLSPLSYWWGIPEIFKQIRLPW